MTYGDDDLLPISALQHLLFCERQCALIHVEQLWQENRLTAEGRVLHEHAHEAGAESRTTVRTVRALPLRSGTLGLYGVADVVEFHAPPGRRACELSHGQFWNDKDALRGWRVLPVEYKRGRRKTTRVDEVQVCAQSLCLEEMTGLEIHEAALFYGEEQGRVMVQIDAQLRELTRRLCDRLRRILTGLITPAAVKTPACKQCSLVEECMPEVTAGHTSVAGFFKELVSQHVACAGPHDD